MENKNLEYWEKFRSVPQTALKTIEKGNLQGKSDINPIWRIKLLTETYGPCGIGWYTEIIKEWTEPAANNEVAMFVKLKLYYKVGNEWSKPVEGTGGNMLINNFKNAGMRSNDEALKMAETDAISVCCKKLGIGADIYWDKDKTKYDFVPGNDIPLNQKVNNSLGKTTEPQQQKYTNTIDYSKVTHKQLKRFWAIAKSKKINQDYIDKCVEIIYNLKTKNDWLKADYDKFTKFMEDNTKDKIIASINEKLKKLGKEILIESNFIKAG
jgi:hypothetical protein